MTTRTYFVLLFLFLPLLIEAQNCLPEGITFSTQADIDNFAINHPGCTEIGGDVLIEPAVDEVITDLLGLAPIAEIHGDLSIRSIPTLVDLGGLDNLTFISGSFNLSRLDALNSIHALASLTEVRQDINFLILPRLTSLDGLHNLNDIKGNLDLRIMERLNKITALSGQDAIAGNLRFDRLTALDNLTGLDDIRTIGGDLLLLQMPIFHLNSLSNLTQVGVSLSLVSLENLTNIEGLSALTIINGGLRIQDAPVLASLEGLHKVQLVGNSLSVTELPVLQDLQGLRSLQEVAFHCTISSNNSLVNLRGLDQLMSTGFSLNITNNQQLIDCAGLEQLTTIGLDLNIFSNANLFAINSMNNVNRIDGDVRIETNESLVNLLGLGQLEQIGDVMTIANNPVLVRTDGLNRLRIVGDLRIIQNAMLNSIAGFGVLELVSGILDINDNPLLLSLNGLENLETVSFIFELTALPELTNLDALSNLTRTWRIRVRDNTNLQDISGLNALNTDEIGAVAIQDNPQLTTCHEEWLCTYLSLPDANSNIASNAPGCESVEEVQGACGLLPVIWGMPLSGQYQPGGIALRWSVVAATGLSHFEVEHSEDGRFFRTIGKVSAPSTIIKEQFFSFLHTQPSANLHFYRIRQVDLDGQTDFSAATMVTVTGDDTIIAYPNPVHETLYLSLPEVESATIWVYDALGNILQQQAGNASLDFGDWPAGLYTVKVHTRGKVQQVSVVHID